MTIFGDIQYIYTKWHGCNLILIAKRRGGRVMNRYVEDFEPESGRLTLVVADVFDVSYFRHMIWAAGGPSTMIAR